MAEANPLENLIDQFIGEENTAWFQGLFQLFRCGGAAEYAEHFLYVVVFIGAWEAVRDYGWGKSAIQRRFHWETPHQHFLNLWSEMVVQENNNLKKGSALIIL